MEQDLTPHRSTWRWPSIQNYPWIRDRDARWLADEYFGWVDRNLPIATARQAQDEVEMSVFPFFGKPAIELCRRKMSEECVRYEVVGGYLTRGPGSGTFTFQKVGSGLRITLADYSPSLPRIIYFFTQAFIHHIVMWLFGRHLERTLQRKRLEEGTNP